MSISKKMPVELPPNKKTLNIVPPYDGNVDDVPVNDNKPLIGFKKEALRNLIRSEIRKALKERGIKRMDEYIGATEEISGINGEIEIGTAHGGTEIAIALRETGTTEPLKYILFEKNKIGEILNALKKYSGVMQ